MTDPLKIMDEIERKQEGGPGPDLKDISWWRRLRTAIEAQAEELAKARARLIPESGDKSPEYCDGWNDGYAERDSERHELGLQKDARIARLELALYEVHALADGGESSMHEIVDVCRAWLKERPRRSVAEIEARALERFRRALRGGTYMDDEWPGINFVEKWLQQEADRIRSEAKDSP